MPVISDFYGIVIFLYYYDKGQHNRPHIHARHAEFEAVIAIDNGDILTGDLPISRMRLVQAWTEIHRKELMRAWELAVTGYKPDKIEPLR